MRIADALAAARARLAAAGIPTPGTDARLLLAHAAGLSPDRLLLHRDDRLDGAAAARLDAALSERIARRPVAQIVGRRLFWGREFRVTSDVLDPRPETETLVEQALKGHFSSILDLGVGSGAILVTLLAERAEARGTGVDISAPALEIARDNARRHGVLARARFLQSDWFGAVTGRFDLVVANPPYISAEEYGRLDPEPRHWEPAVALTPGGDGLDAYRKIARDAAAFLAPGGRLLVEIGPTQAPAVAALLGTIGPGSVRVFQDLDGRDRVVGYFDTGAA